MKRLTWKDRLTEIIRDCDPVEAMERAQFALGLAKVRQPMQVRTKAKVGTTKTRVNAKASTLTSAENRQMDEHVAHSG